MIRLVIDYSLCTGNGRCYAVHPDLFTDDERGYGHVVGEGVLEGHRREEAERALLCCPEQAITLESA